MTYPKPRPERTPPHVSLRVLRNASRMTLDEVCAAASEVLPTPLTRGALSAIENGIRGASPSTLAALEVAYGLSPGAIVHRLRAAQPRAGVGMTPAEYGAQLAAVASPLTPEQVEAAARLLACVEDEQVAA